MKNKVPFKKDLKELAKRIKRYVLENPDLFWNVETEQSECQLTVGCDGVSTDFGYQTGDNSYSGGAYSYPHWAIVTITNHSNIEEVSKDLINQFYDLINQ